MFEIASRKKIRFNYKGLASAEDLWDIPLNSLNAMYQQLNAQMKQQSEESLLEEEGKPDECIKDLELKINLIKHVVTVRLKERKDRAEILEKRAKKQKLLGIIMKKQDEDFEGMSLEDLNKLVDEL